MAHPDHPPRLLVDRSAFLRVRAAVAIAGFLLLLGGGPARADDTDVCGLAGGETSVAACSRLIEGGRLTKPDLTMAYRNRATAWTGLKDRTRAIADYDQIIKLNPADAVSFARRCQLRTDNGAPNGALPDCAQAIKLDPNNAMAYSGRCAAHLARLDYDPAIEDCAKAIAIDPSDAVSFDNRGIAYAGKHENAKAITDFDTAIARDPARQAAYHHRGVTRMNLDDNGPAIADFTRAIEISPRDPQPYYHRATASIKLNDTHQAAIDYDTTLRLDPDYVDALFARGRLGLEVGAISHAQNDFERAVALQPHHVYAALWLEIARRRNGLSGSIAQYLPKFDMKKWPAPIVELYLGRNSAHGALQAAASADKTTALEQLCEADFYVAEFNWLQNSLAEAAGLFNAAIKDCPHAFIERRGAITELRNLLK